MSGLESIVEMFGNSCTAIECCPVVGLVISMLYTVRVIASTLSGV